MKKTILCVVTLFLLCISTNIKAQTNDNWNNYIKFQFVQPIGEYSDYYHAGVGLEYGRMFPFNFDIANGLLKPGLDITFIQTTLNTGKEHTYYSDYNTKGGFLWNFGIKLGPMMSINIVDDLKGDFAIQYAPTLIMGYRKGLSSIEDREDYTTTSSISFAHRLSMKADIRYQHFLFGMELLFGQATLNYGKSIIPYYNNTTNAVALKDKKDLGLNTLLLNFGFTF